MDCLMKKISNITEPHRRGLCTHGNIDQDNQECIAVKPHEKESHGRFFGHHQGREQFGRGNGSARRERILTQGDLRLLILNELVQKDGYGYELIKAIGERVGDDYMPSPGIIYPTLMYLGETGLVQLDVSNLTKKVYQITEAGKNFITDHQGELVKIFTRLEHRKKSSDAGKVPELHRAITNIKLVLNLKIDSKTLDETKLKEVVKILDQAASDINQL